MPERLSAQRRWRTCSDSAALGGPPRRAAIALFQTSKAVSASAAVPSRTMAGMSAFVAIGTAADGYVEDGVLGSPFSIEIPWSPHAFTREASALGDSR